MRSQTLDHVLGPLQREHGFERFFAADCSERSGRPNSLVVRLEEQARIAPRTETHLDPARDRVLRIRSRDVAECLKKSPKGLGLDLDRSNQCVLCHGRPAHYCLGRNVHLAIPLLCFGNDLRLDGLIVWPWALELSVFHGLRHFLWKLNDPPPSLRPVLNNQRLIIRHDASLRGLCLKKRQPMGAPLPHRLSNPATAKKQVTLLAVGPASRSLATDLLSWAQ